MAKSLLRSIRERRGLSLEAMGVECNVSAAYLSRVENGLIRSMDIQRANRIAKGYGVEMEFELGVRGLPKFRMRARS